MEQMQKCSRSKITFTNETKNRPYYKKTVLVELACISNHSTGLDPMLGFVSCVNGVSCVCVVDFVCWCSTHGGPLIEPANGYSLNVGVHIG